MCRGIALQVLNDTVCVCAAGQADGNCLDLDEVVATNTHTVLYIWVIVIVAIVMVVATCLCVWLRRAQGAAFAATRGGRSTRVLGKRGTWSRMAQKAPSVPEPLLKQ